MNEIQQALINIGAVGIMDGLERLKRAVDYLKIVSNVLEQ